MGEPDLDEAVDRAVSGLLRLRRPDGSWSGRLSSAATASGAAVIALHMVDPEANRDVVDPAARWLRAVQDDCGGWAEHPGGPATINATAIAVAALAFAGGPESADAVRRGRRELARMGGTGALEDRETCSLSAVVRQFLAWADLYDPSRLSRVPVELALMPAGLRGKLSFTVPGVLSWGVMHARRGRHGRLRRLVNRLAEPRALRYLERLQDFAGVDRGFEESPLMTACVAVGLHRAGVRPDLVRQCAAYLRATVRDDCWSVNRDLEIPVTGYVLAGLRDAGADVDTDPTVAWLRSTQRFEPFPTTGCPPGGWGWAYSSGWPNTGDTTAALIALARCGIAPTDPMVDAGVSWLLHLQDRAGGWACFRRGSVRTLDAPCAVMTADAVSALHGAGKVPASHPALVRALDWLAGTQHADGSFGSRWYTGPTSGTACVLRALGELRRSTDDVGHRCRDWLLRNQSDDGSWGGAAGCPGTVEETSWAVLGLLSADTDVHDPDGLAAVRRAGEYLRHTQRDDGLWTPAVYGIYFLDLLYASDHHANGHALQALARLRDLDRSRAVVSSVSGGIR